MIRVWQEILGNKGRTTQDNTGKMKNTVKAQNRESIRHVV